MAEKNETRVLIKGKILTLSGYEPTEYQQKVAMYVNDKYAECERLGSFRFLNSDTKSILLDLNIADDYFKAKSHLEVLEMEFEAKNKEIEKFKEEIVTLNKKLSESKSQVAELQEKTAENVARIMRLETDLKKKN